MKKLLIPIFWLLILLIPVRAMEFSAPIAPDRAQTYMPQETESFGEGLWYVIKTAISELQPSIAETSAICLSLIVVNILVSVLQNFSGSGKLTVEIAGILLISVVLLQPANALLQLGIETIEDLSAYGKLLLPVMTAAVAAQGGATTSAALYTGTVFFNSVLTIV